MPISPCIGTNTLAAASSHKNESNHTTNTPSLLPPTYPSAQQSVHRHNNTIIMICIMCVHDVCVVSRDRQRRPRRGRWSPPLWHSRGTSKPFVVIRSRCSASCSNRSCVSALRRFFFLQKHTQRLLPYVKYSHIMGKNLYRYISILTAILSNLLPATFAVRDLIIF